MLFTAKVRRCTKGHHNAELLAHSTVRARERVVGLAGDIRELVITRRGRVEYQELNALQEEIRRERLLREEAESEAMRLTTHRDALLKNLDHLHLQLGAWKGRCQLLDRLNLSVIRIELANEPEALAKLCPSTASQTDANHPGSHPRHRQPV